MRPHHLIGSLITAGIIFSGCGSDSEVVESPSSSSSMMSSSSVSSAESSLSTSSAASSASAPMFRVTVTNLTHAQPMSPLAAALHTDATELFTVGTRATEGLEHLAEGGDNTLLLAEATDAVMTQGGSGLLVPGGSQSVTLEGDGATCVSLATMLVNTNDAFAGANCIDITMMQTGATMTAHGLTYDAGTEGNAELAASIPGPAGGGEGYNAARDDRDFVTLHAGVVTADDGLPDSALTYAHRWDNPALHILIERLQ